MVSFSAKLINEVPVLVDTILDSQNN